MNDWRRQATDTWRARSDAIAAKPAEPRDRMSAPGGGNGCSALESLTGLGDETVTTRLDGRGSSWVSPHTPSPLSEAAFFDRRAE
jgi:hypothetical protein